MMSANSDRVAGSLSSQSHFPHIRQYIVQSLFLRVTSSFHQNDVPASHTDEIISIQIHDGLWPQLASVVAWPHQSKEELSRLRLVVSTTTKRLQPSIWSLEKASTGNKYVTLYDIVTTTLLH